MDHGSRIKDPGSRIMDHGSCSGTNDHPRRDTGVILRLSKAPLSSSPILDRSHNPNLVSNHGLQPNIDFGTCLGKNEHPKRDMDVILRQSKALIGILNSR